MSRAMPSNVPALLFSSSGRLDQRTFAYTVVAFYAVGLASQFLLSAAVTGRAGLWPFALAQVVLTWVWFALHAKRMRDAGRGIGGSLTIAILYAVPVMLLVALMAAFFSSPSSSSTEQGPMAGLGALLLLSIIYALVLYPSKFGLLLTAILLGLALFAYVPMLIALIWSVWTGTRPSASQP